MNKHPVGRALRRCKNLLDLAERDSDRRFWGEATDILDDLDSKKIYATEEGRQWRERASKLRVRAENIRKKTV